MRFLVLLISGFFAYMVTGLLTPVVFNQSLEFPNLLPGIFFAGIVGFLLRWWDGWRSKIQKPFQKQSVTLETKEAPAPIVIDGCLSFMTGLFFISAFIMLVIGLAISNPPGFLVEVFKQLNLSSLISGK